MQKITITTINAVSQQLCKKILTLHPTKLNTQQSQTIGELFTLWQLTWVLFSCGHPLPPAVREHFYRIIEELPTTLPCDQITKQNSLLIAWMKLQCLPQSADLQSPVPAAHSTNGSFTDFVKIIKNYLDVERPKNNSDDLVFYVLEHLCGIPPERKNTVLHLLHETQAQISRPHLRIVPQSSLQVKQQPKSRGQTPPQPWLDSRTVGTWIENNLGAVLQNSTAAIFIVPCPLPVTVPMTWMLKTNDSNTPCSEGSNAQTSGLPSDPCKASVVQLFIGWPASTPQQINMGPCLAEQYALIAHESCHLRQLIEEEALGSLQRTDSNLLATGTLGRKLTLYEREWQALNCEWNELQKQCQSMSQNETQALCAHWWTTHTTRQKELFLSDLRRIEEVMSQEDVHSSDLRGCARTSASYDEPPLRLPLTSLVYALCAHDLRQQLT